MLETDSDFWFNIGNVDVKSEKYSATLGFRILTITIILGINAKDLQTEQGRKVKEYIESKVLDLPFVVIKTYSRDIYLRYLADIFYLQDSKDVYAVVKQGKYLNQELMDEGLAAKYWRW